MSLIVRKKSYILVISIIINVLLSVRHIFNINGKTQYFIYKIYTDTTESLIALSVMMIVIVVCIISAKILIGKKDWHIEMQKALMEVLYNEYNIR